MNKKYSDEVKMKIRSMRAQGMTYEAIAEELGMLKQTVHWIHNHDKYLNNGIHDCIFCKSSRTVLHHTRNKNHNNPGTNFYVKCCACNARGPQLTLLDNSSVSIETVKRLAINQWNRISEL